MSKKEKRSTKKSIVFLGAAAFVIAAVLILVFLFRVQQIEVTGNEFCSSEAIEDWVMKDVYLDNSILAVLQSKDKADAPPVVDSVKVSLSLPWALRVSVKEKEMAGYFRQEKKNYYFDQEGYVLCATKETYDGVIQVEGFVSQSTAPGEQIATEYPEVFASIAEVSAALKEQKLSPDKMKVEDDEISLVFKMIQVKLGKDELTGRVAQLPEILQMLSGESGTLHVEKYTSDSKAIWFEDAKNEKISVKSID